MATKAALAYVHRNSYFHGLNPFTILIYTGCITLLGIAVSQIWVLNLIFIVNLILVWRAQVMRDFLKMFLRITLPIVIPMLLLNTFFNPASSTVLFKIGPIAVKEEGLMFAITVISRLLAILSAYFFMVLVVHPRDLMITLGNRGVSPKFGYLVLSTLQFIPHIQQTATRILDAQQSRGLSLKGNIFKRFKSYVPLMAPVVMGGFTSMEIRAMALEVRGFNLKTKPVYIRDVPDTSQDKLLRKVIFAFTLIIVISSIYFAYIH